MDEQLILKLQEPELPEKWNYDESISKVTGITYKWKDLTIELANELWIAREKLRIDESDAAKIMHGILVPRKDWTQYCEDIGSSRQVVNRWLNRWFVKEIKEVDTPLLPPGKFAVIYADPPWQYSNTGFDQSASSHYPTLTEEKIIELKDNSLRAITDLSDKSTVLFLWATNPLIPEAIHVLEGWGFQYKTNMAWIKDRGRGKGWWLKSKHELLFIGVKEKTPHPKERFDSCFEAKRESKHSKKPETVYEFIEKMYPGSKDETYYVELFARISYPGWKAWGNQL